MSAQPVEDPAPYPAFDGSQRCAAPGVDPEAFFPRKGGTEEIAAALAACHCCPFREPCGAYALTHNVRGVWGGLTEPTRRAIQRAHRITPVPLTLTA